LELRIIPRSRIFRVRDTTGKSNDSAADKVAIAGMPTLLAVRSPPPSGSSMVDGRLLQDH